MNAREIELVTLCTDTPAQIRKGQAKHGLRAVMLSDRDLGVTRAFGIENTATQLRPPGVSGLPIPTTILVDAAGVVRWLDQADDYQLRSAPERVSAAIRAALD